MLIVYFCSSGGSPPAPTAKILDTFLRIASPSMFSKYNRYFMTTLIMIRDQVCPILVDTGENGTFKEMLIDFLDTFISSDGRESLPMI